MPGKRGSTAWTSGDTPRGSVDLGAGAGKHVIRRNMSRFLSLSLSPSSPLSHCTAILLSLDTTFEPGGVGFLPLMALCRDFWQSCYDPTVYISFVCYCKSLCCLPLHLFQQHSQLKPTPLRCPLPSSCSPHMQIVIICTCVRPSARAFAAISLFQRNFPRHLHYPTSPTQYYLTLARSSHLPLTPALSSCTDVLTCGYILWRARVHSLQHR